MLYYTANAADLYMLITDGIKKADVKVFSDYFAPNIKVVIEDRNDVYSKTQAEVMVKIFLTKYPTRSFVFDKTNQPASNGEMALGTLITSSGQKFKVSVVTKQQLIQEIKFEPAA
jgi:hypothetical protein